MRQAAPVWWRRRSIRYRGRCGGDEAGEDIAGELVVGVEAGGEVSLVVVLLLDHAKEKTAAGEAAAMAKVSRLLVM